MLSHIALLCNAYCCSPWVRGWGPFLPMQTWGERLRLRARELGLTDAEVARRLGLAQGRYSAYVNMAREPDLALFLRICQVLGTTPDVILGVVQGERDETPMMTEIVAGLRTFDDDRLALVAGLVRAVVEHGAAASVPGGQPTQTAKAPRQRRSGPDAK